MRLILLCLLGLNLAAMSAPKEAKPPQARVLITTTGDILSTGGPLQFDEKGIKFIGRPTYKGNTEIIGEYMFSPSPDYFAMIQRNMKQADASLHIQVKDGKLYHDGGLVNFDGLTVKWMGSGAVFWLDWVVGPGNTSKSGQPSMNNLEPHELLYYNFKTLRGGAIRLGGKGPSGEVRILTN